MMNKMNKIKKPVIQQESGIQCVICQEGYNLAPQKLLGVYTYLSPLKLPPFPFPQKFYSTPSTPSLTPSKSPATPSLGISSVSHLNFIHLACHLTSLSTEKLQKPPRSEWENALIRNQHTKCNCWVPFREKLVTEREYAEGVAKMAGSVETVIREKGDMGFIGIHDLRQLIAMMCNGEDLSKNSLG
jgi:hypothetical protein